MTRIDLLLHGIPGRSNQGYLGQSSAALVDGTTVIDTGSLARRPLLESSLSNAGVDPRDVEDVLLTHMHFDHCGNVDLFGEATVHVYGPELDRVRRGDTDWATPAWADAALAASLFHDRVLSVGEVKAHLAAQGVLVRTTEVNDDAYA